ncbi:hypothetical protein [Sinimarinibacterium flocculans]|uniref:hypothetical protein n=1 Tax=Sinimarinibacterium flocculans TaxID=985250 RepID=UPI000E9352A6|nr:hypothetical protein [Sinimarinibacterium flocculans]HBG31530.1 hypothetical protein [Gammaproteobacteria bacterium]
MKSKELQEALRLITKVLNDPRLGPGRGDRLRVAKRELEMAARSGKLDRQKLFLATEIVMAVLAELVEQQAG